jgi:hypothetical protein
MCHELIAETRHLNGASKAIERYTRIKHDEGILAAFVIFLGFLPLFAPFPLAMNVDPFHFAFRAIFPEQLYVSPGGRALEYCLRMFYSVISIIEVTRLSSIIVLVLEHLFLRCCFCIELISILQSKSTMSHRRRSLRAIILLEKLSIIVYRHLASFVTSALGILLTMYFSTVILSTFVSFKMHNVLPLLFYLPFPTISLSTVLIISTVLPASIRVHNLSRSLLRGWKFDYLQMGHFERKVYLRNVRAVAPVRFAAGIFDCRMFWINSKVKAEFYKWLTDFSMDAILSVDID